jgi:hypothetical protein
MGHRANRAVVFVCAGLALGLSVEGAGIASARSSTKQTTIHFSVSERSHRAVSKGRELTRASGGGTLTLAAKPQVNVLYHATSANGTITFHLWRVVGGRVIDEDNVTMNVTSATYRFTKTVSNVNTDVTVAKTDPKETDSCPAGATGQVGFLDGRVKAQPDDFNPELCGQHEIDYGGLKGRHATVAITVKPETP